jgi:hypothetical protein
MAELAQLCDFPDVQVEVQVRARVRPAPQLRWRKRSRRNLAGPTLNTRSNSGFTVKYLKNGNIQGNNIYICRQTVAANSVWPLADNIAVVGVGACPRPTKSRG